MTRIVRLVAIATMPSWLACESTPPAPHVPSCTYRMASMAGAEVVLEGTSDDCAGSIPIHLRFGVGDPANPDWSSQLLRVDGDWTQDGALLRRTVSVRNTGPTPIALVAIEWTADLADTRLDADRLLHMGFQSWSYTGVEAIPSSIPDDRGTAKASGGDGNVLGETQGVSWEYGVAGNQNELGLFLGADGATVLRTYVAVELARARIVMGGPGESLVIAPGETRALDGIVVALGESRALLDAYAAAVAAKHPPAMAPKPPLAGWGSWNVYYDAPTASVLRDEIAWAKSTLAPTGMRDFLLDDGYEAFWGDWTAKPEFGEDLGAFAAEVTQAGLVPGIWLAPFYADVRSTTFQMHPDWMVHDANGVPIAITEPSGLSYGVLDPTNDAVRAYFTSLFGDLFAKGFRTFKLDYLYAGATIGRRAKPVTGLEALAVGLGTIRSAVPGAHLIGCGAPQLASVGWFDSMRIGADIAYKTSPEPKYGFISAEARSTFYRAHTGAWWALDPDVVLLRGNGIDDTVAWTHVVATAMSGGNDLLGDGRQTSAARLAMTQNAEVLALARERTAGRPVDGFAQMDGSPIPSPIIDPNGRGRVPHLVQKKSADGARNWMAYFAWDDDSFASPLAMPNGAVEILPDGSTKPVSKPPIIVPQGGVRLFRF